jgi:predicted enzyme related to lactoylglutathione lyase
MPLTPTHAPGSPIWIDASVPTAVQRLALIDFYSSVFGWKFELGGPETGFYSIAYKESAPILGIGEQAGGDGRWITYFSTDDIEAMAGRVKAFGGHVFLGPLNVMTLGRMAQATDSTGAVHGLWQPNTFNGFGVMGEVNSIGWFDHVSENQHESATYYTSVLGEEIGLHAQGDMLVLTRGEEWFASLSFGDSGETPPQWMPVFIVNSLDETKHVVRQLGGKIVVEKMDVPGSVIAIFQDPVVFSYITIMQSEQN